VGDPNTRRKTTEEESQGEKNGKTQTKKPEFETGLTVWKKSDERGD